MEKLHSFLFNQSKPYPFKFDNSNQKKNFFFELRTQFKLFNEFLNVTSDIIDPETQAILRLSESTPSLSLEKFSIDHLAGKKNYLKFPKEWIESLEVVSFFFFSFSFFSSFFQVKK